MRRATHRVLRALCSTLILLCLLAVGRPAPQQRVLDEDAKLAPAHDHVAPPAVRRSLGEHQVRAPLFVLAPDAGEAPPRAAIVVEAQRVPALRFALFVHSGSARGPPQA